MANPVWRRELGLITRSWRVSWVLMTLVILAGGLVLLALAAAATGQVGGGLPSRTGVQLFSLLGLLQLGLVMLVAPGLTAGAISGERERRTLEPLFQTGLSATAFVSGKLGAALAYLSLLFLALAPVMGILLLLGGVHPKQALLVYSVLLATALMQTTVGLFASALSRRTQAAASAAYVLTALMILLALLPTWVAGPALSTWGVKPPVFVIAAMANPVAALAATTGGPVYSPLLNAVLGSTTVVSGSPSGGSGAAGATGGFGAAFAASAYQGLAAGGSGAQAAATRLPIPFITYGYLLFAAVVSLVLWGVSILAVRPPSGPLLRLRRSAKGGDEAG